ncbi:MAG: heme exporter protein CcmD [Hyphomicrobiales bacterium]|nr:heme exporter protein CcmD [Hyphomicrobiales bacterium]
MSLGPYASFIVMSYALALPAFEVRLHALEQSGAARRSGRGATDLK